MKGWGKGLRGWGWGGQVLGKWGRAGVGKGRWFGR